MMLRKKDIAYLKNASQEVFNPSKMSNDKKLAIILANVKSVIINTGNHQLINDMNYSDLSVRPDTHHPEYFNYYTCGNLAGRVTGNVAYQLIRSYVKEAVDIYNNHRDYLLVNSTNKDTVYGHKNLLAFFIGNQFGIEREQAQANQNGTHNFQLYIQEGSSQGMEDQEYINKCKKGLYFEVPKPKYLLNSNQAIVKNIKLGKKLLRAKKLGDKEDKIFNQEQNKSKNIA